MPSPSTASAPADPESQRRALLAAASRLVRQKPAEPLTPTRLCQEAGVSEAAFATNWPEALAFERQLLVSLLDEVRDSVAKTTLGMAPGLARLKLAVEAYLDANRARPAVRALALKLQADADGAATLRSRVAGFTLMMEMELQAMQWPHPAATARLFTAAVLETAYAEHEAGAKVPALRDCVFRYFDNGRA
ncbi:MAG TPA: hypothetical protein VGE57_02845 [Solimonas sp.]